jgi:predicted DCC family thiol-disulfide oxidoreductase YuxK
VVAVSAALLYDGDCGFCRTCVAVLLTWDRHRRLQPVAIQSAEGARLLADLTEEQRLDSWHLVSVDAGQAAAAETPSRDDRRQPSAGAPSRDRTQRRSAGAAFPSVFRQLPGGGPLASLAARFPTATERGYRWVADHRTQLSRLVPARVKRRADRTIVNRGQDKPAASR